jgi:hypothetical protein
MQRRHPQDQDEHGRDPYERVRGYAGYNGRREEEQSREPWRQGGRDQEYDERLGRWQFDESGSQRNRSRSENGGDYGGGGYAEGPRRWQGEGYAGRGESREWGSRYRAGGPFDEGDFGGSFGRERPRERSGGGYEDRDREFRTGGSRFGGSDWQQRGFEERGYGERGYGERDYGERRERAFGRFGGNDPRDYGERSDYGERGAYRGLGNAGRRGSESGSEGLRFGDFRRFSGRGPKGYQRSDERIREDVCDRFTSDPDLDAGEITVTVKNCEVTLEGTVEDRQMKRHAEDCADDISGVRQVHNRLQIQERSGEHQTSQSGQSKAQTAGRAS